MREKTTSICPMCKTEFTPAQSAQKYCSVKCRRAYYAQEKRNVTNRYECNWCGTIFHSDRKKKFCCEECRIKSYKKRPAKRKKPKLTLAEINALARKEGLNYGQYVAKYGL